MRIRSPILTAVGLAALALAPAAHALPIASISQVQQNATPFTYNAAAGTFGAAALVDFNFLVANNSGVATPIPAALTLTGTTTGPVTSIGSLLVEQVQSATFSIVAVGGPLAGMNL